MQEKRKEIRITELITFETLLPPPPRRKTLITWLDLMWITMDNDGKSYG